MLTQTRTTAKLRTGDEYIRSIKADGRQVFVNGEPKRLDVRRVNTA